MTPFVQDLRDPASETLAATHFKNRYIQDHHCYTCHSDYGLAGTLSAKLGGLGHVWRYTTGSYTLPIKIAKPYSNTQCLQCHGASQKFLKSRDTPRRRCPGSWPARARVSTVTPPRTPSREGGEPMSVGSPVRVGALRLAILLTAAFNVLAVVVLVRDAPIAFTVFMFLALRLGVALILLVGAALADLARRRYRTRSRDRMTFA